MEQNIDDFLSSLGITQDKFKVELPDSNGDYITVNATADTYTVPTAEEALDMVSSTTTTQANSSISDADVNDILDQFGIGAPTEEPVDVDEESSNEDDDIEWSDVDDYEINISSTDVAETTISSSEAIAVAPTPEVIAETDTEAEQAPRRTRRSRRNSTLDTNSPSLLLDQSTSRFSGAEWYHAIQQQKVILAGLGGIGSWTAIQLARMCPETLVLYDNDIVEAANMSGQLYARQDVGAAKVDALVTFIENYTSMGVNGDLYGVQERFTANTEAGDIMICGFDSMEARRLFFEKWVAHTAQVSDKSKCVFIDGRLSMNDIQIFCITGDNDYAKLNYERNYLFNDSEADETICSMKQTTYLACMIGSLITNLFTNFVADTLNPEISYDLPFLTEYDAQNMIFKTKN